MEAACTHITGGLQPSQAPGLHTPDQSTARTAVAGGWAAGPNAWPKPPDPSQPLFVRGCGPRGHGPRVPLDIWITPRLSQDSPQEMQEAVLNTVSYTQPPRSETQCPTRGLSEWLLSKKEQTTSAGEDVEKSEALCTAGTAN